jgi:hypothetical protein
VTIVIRASRGLQTSGFFAVATIRTLFETTFFAGLRNAGMPEE